MDVNPWKVESMEAFYSFLCPECGFNSKEGTFFQDHAIKNHPLSLVLFENSHEPKFNDVKYRNSEENLDGVQSDLVDNIEFKEEISEVDNVKQEGAYYSDQIVEESYESLNELASNYDQFEAHDPSYDCKTHVF